MFGPYRLTCADCPFETKVVGGETAQSTAELHGNRYGHAVRITDVNTGAAVEVER